MSGAVAKIYQQKCSACSGYDGAPFVGRIVAVNNQGGSLFEDGHQVAQYSISSLYDGWFVFYKRNDPHSFSLYGDNAGGILADWSAVSKRSTSEQKENKSSSMCRALLLCP
jgi:hypothetical protein